jgi:hypothetical protein
MKKYLRGLLAFTFASAMLTSCNTEDTSMADVSTKSPVGLKSGNWDGVIATENPDGTFEFKVDKELLMRDLEVQLSDQGDEGVDLQTITIQKKAAANDAKEMGYMLIASDGQGVSIGLMLTQSKTKDDYDLGTDPDPSTITCRGCATGCNLEHLNMPGGKVPYCNTNGCGDFCQTKYATN